MNLTLTYIYMESDLAFTGLGSFILCSQFYSIFAGWIASNVQFLAETLAIKLEYINCDWRRAKK